MNVTQRFTLLVKGSFDAVLEKLEDPERSLNQLVIDMEEELEVAKRLVARAMANEDRLRDRVDFHDKDARSWQEAAERAMGKGDEHGARDMLRRLESAERQRDRLAEELSAQSAETEDIRKSVVEMHQRMEQARSRLELVHARMRQGEARRSMNKVMGGVHKANLHSEFDRLCDRVTVDAAVERSYLKLDDEMRGDALRRHAEASAVDDAVDDRFEALKKNVEDARTSEGEKGS